MAKTIVVGLNNDTENTSATTEKDFSVSVGSIYRTASIDYLEGKAMFADFASRTFGETDFQYFGNVDDTDEKILKTISKETGKVFQAITEKHIVSKLYRISTSDYVKYGECIGDARERKTH